MLSKKLLPVAVGLLFINGTATAQDGATVVANAQRALGDLTSISYSGAAKDVFFQQCGANAVTPRCLGMHDPMRPIGQYVRVVDLAARTLREAGTTNNATPGRLVTVPAMFFQQVTPQAADISQQWGASVELYLTPWGFLKGASENNATVSRKRISGKNYTVLTWRPAVKAPSGKDYVINGYLADRNLIERVETWLGDTVMGDMDILATYTGWRDFGGVMAPSKIVQTRGGWPYFEVDVVSATGNPPNVAALVPPPTPPAGRGGGAAAGGAAGGGGRGGAPAMTVMAEKLGEGLYRLTSGPGGYDSIIVEFKDHTMLLEAPQSEARGLAYIAEAKKLVPNKPLRYVMNTHPHSDHTAGLPAVAAEGATIITHRNNEAFLRTALNTPRTLLDDALARNPRKVQIETVSDKKIYSDGARSVEIYRVDPNPHTNGMLLAYIPKEKILFSADFSLPAQGQATSDNVLALVPVLDRLKLDFDRYISVHSSPAPQRKVDFLRAVGR